MATNNKNSDTQKKVAIGAGLAALAAAAAGAYFLYGTKEGSKRRAQVKGWMLKMKGEVLDRMEKLKDVSEDTYSEMVDKVARTYEGMKQVDPVEVAALAKTLKGHWSNIRRHITAENKKPVKRKTSKKKSAQ